jgi:ParB-like chromosome segregation protein Spo0J
MPNAKPLACHAQVRITYRSLTELKPDPRNARVHSKAQIRQLAASIREFGFNIPLVIDANDNVLAGHGRLLACRELGYPSYPPSGSSI